MSAAAGETWSRALSEAFSAAFDELTDPQRARLLADLARRRAAAFAAMIKLLEGAFSGSDLDMVKSACAEAFDLAAEASDFAASDLIDALESKAELPEFEQRRLGEMLGFRANVDEAVAIAIAEIKAGDTASAIRTLEDAAPSAQLDDLAHLGRAQVLFDLRGKS